MNKSAIDIDKIFKCYYRPLCLYALHYVHNTDISEDIVQDSFFSLWERINSVEIENVKAYLYKTVRNRSLDYLKENSIYETNLSPFDLEDILTDEEAEERSLAEARMWTIIDTLSERCREIADRLHISVNTVDNHISKALRLIREGAQKIYIFLFN